jgi:hypothetical protein
MRWSFRRIGRARMTSKCHDCGQPAFVRVRTSKDRPFESVCENCRIAIVRRIEQVVRTLGQAGPYASAVVIKSLEMIEFEDL